MTRFKNPHLVLTIILLLFFAIFVTKSLTTMATVSFYDFDEAHRAENAKRMKEYRSFLVPLTGSSQDRVEHLKIPLKENSDFYLYYHLERPPLIYDLMILSTSLFGSSEWTYRLPSFLLGLTTLIAFLFFARREKPSDYFAIVVGGVTLITSTDLWLSSQYAQMDTGITLFLTLSLLTLITFCNLRKVLLLYLAGIFFGLGLLSKLQPTIIFIFPILFLLLTRRIEIKDVIKFVIGFLLVFGPWFLYLVARFGFKDVLFIMPGFALTSASIIDIHQKAPFFWYIRWWWESLRPGLTIFLALFFYDAFSGKLTWQKKTLLAYIFGGLLAFSIPTNKIWWYVLSLIPAVSFYIFLSVRDYLEKQQKIVNLAFALIVASLPIFLKSSNTITLIYGFSVTFVVFLILIDKLTFKINIVSSINTFYISIIFTLIFFLLQFPQITPYHRNTKKVAEYYKSLPYPKCLWLGDMPSEAVLFYSNAGEVPILNNNKNTQIYTNCKNNYLITPDKYKEGELIKRLGNIRLYKL